MTRHTLVARRKKFLPRLAAATGAVMLGATLAVPAAQADDDEEEEDVTPAHEEEGGVAYEPDDEDVNVLYIATNQSIEDWNPFNQLYVIEHAFRQLTYEPLVRASSEDYSPEPALAEDWDVSDDGLVWTYYLHEDAVWHDGEPVTAEDVEYTYHIIANDPGIEGGSRDEDRTVQNIEVIDEHTVEFTLNQTDVGFEFTDQVILPKHIWEEHEGEWSDWAHDEFPLIGAGPYQMVDYQVDTYIRFERHDDYFRGPAGFDEIVYQYYTEPDTAVAALEAGYVDIVGGLNEAQIQRLDGVEGIEINTGPNRRWSALRFNTGSQTADGEEFGDVHPAVFDADVRTALHHAIDRESLIENVVDGYADPATSIVPALFSTIWWEPEDDERIDFDLDAANALLDEAGYPMGADGIREDPEHGPLEFRLTIAPDASDSIHISEYLTEWFGEIGVDLEVIFSEESGVAFNEGRSEMSITGWGIQPNPVYNLRRQSCDALPAEIGGSTSDAFYCNPDFDQIVDASQTELDEDARQELYFEAQRILYHDAPMIFLWYPQVMEAYNAVKISDITTQPEDEGMILGQSGPWSFWSAQPTGENIGGVSTNVLIGTGVVVVVGAALAVVLFVRRKQTAEDRE